MALPQIDITTEPDFANPLATGDKGLGVQSGILGQYTIQHVFDLLISVLGTEINGLSAVGSPALTDEIAAYAGSAPAEKETWAQILALFQANGTMPVNIQTGTTYTLTISDLGKILIFTNSGAITVTLPQQSDIALPLGFNCMIRSDTGAGVITFTTEGTDSIVGKTGTGGNATGDAGIYLRAIAAGVSTFDVFGGS